MLKKLNPENYFYWDEKTHDLPMAADQGAYVLFIELHANVSVYKPLRTMLRPALYAYCGSARRGILTRLQWHFKKSKKITWHVDQLTSQGEIIGVMWSKRLNECEFSRIFREKGYREPIRGFGSSDCKKKCYSHFFQVASETREPFFNFHVGLDLSRDI